MALNAFLIYLHESLKVIFYNLKLNTYNYIKIRMNS